MTISSLLTQSLQARRGPAAPSGLDNLNRKISGGESFSSAFLKDITSRTKGFEQQAEGLRVRGDRDIDATGQEMRRLRSGAGSAVQQKFGAVRGRRGFARNLEQTLRRGKARQGIVARGDKSVLNQQLKDRLAGARQDIARRGVVQQTVGDAGRIRSGLDTSLRSSSDSVNQAFAGAAGSIAGGLIGGFGDKLFSSKGVSVGMDQGTASADAINSSGFDFSFDPETFGTGVQPGGIMFS